MPRRPILLFDVMDTLVVEPYFTVMPQFFGLSLEELRQQRHPTSWIRFEYGQLTEAEYYARAFRDRRPVDGETLRQRLFEAYCWIDGMEGLLADLKTAGYEIHALSNYPTWYHLIEEKLQLSRYLQWSFVSCDIGFRKPDAEAYLTAAQRLDVPPSDCLFVDDRQVNIDAACALSMDAILKESAAQVRQQLVVRELLDG